MVMMRLPGIVFSRRNKILVATLIIALSIPLTLALIRVSQELRRRAAAPVVKTYRFTSVAASDGFLEKRVEFAGNYPGSCLRAYQTAADKEPQVFTGEREGYVGSLCAPSGEGRYWIRRLYLIFDTSTIPVEETVTTARLCLTVKDNYSTLSSDRQKISVDVYRTFWQDEETLSPSDWEGEETFFEGRLLTDFGEIPRIKDVTYYLPVDPTAINKEGRTAYRLNAAEEIITEETAVELPVWTRFLPFYTGEAGNFAPCLEVTTESPPPERASIRGVKFEDLNANQTQDAEEPGMAAVNIILKDGEGNELSRVTTDENGGFSFTNLELGTYVVAEETPAGFVATTPTEYTVDLKQGGEEKQLSFGNRAQPSPERGRIFGYKFEDQNANGVWDTGEPPYREGVVITLSAPDLERDDVTDEDGYYEFGDLEPGTYRVTETVPENWRATGRFSQEVQIGPGEAYEVDFGNIAVEPAKGRIYGHKFLDSNENGNLDDGELGIGGVLITLKDDTGTVLATEQTREGTDTGFFVFSDLTAGGYTLTETVPVGYTATTPTTVSVSLGAGEQKEVNFGNQMIGGAVENKIPRCLSLTATPLRGEPPLTVSFVAAAEDPDGTISRYLYDFGDDSTPQSLTSSTATHTYAQPGVFNAFLRVEDNDGATATSGTCRQTITVTAAETTTREPQPPLCQSLTATPASGEAPLTVTFVATAQDPDGDIRQYQFDFGDGSGVEVSSTALTNHVYTQSGTYTAALTVVDNEDLSATSADCQTTITVNEPAEEEAPPVTITSTPTDSSPVPPTGRLIKTGTLIFTSLTLIALGLLTVL